MLRAAVSALPRASARRCARPGPAGGPSPPPAASSAFSSDHGPIHYDATSSDVEDLIERSIDKTTYRKKDETPFRLLTTRREAIHLYREIFRITALFTWPDQSGVPWRDVLRRSARQEFEAARFETDPEILNRLLVVGRDAVHQVAEKFAEQHRKVVGPLPGDVGGLPGGPGA